MWLDVKPSRKHTAQNTTFDTGHIIRSTLDTFYEAPHGANELAFIDIVYLDDIMLFDATLPPHPYKKCEAMAHRALFQHDHELRQQCDKNLADLEASTTTVAFTIMSSTATEFLKRPQDIFHPGYHRQMAKADGQSAAAHGIAIRRANETIICLAGSTASNVELLTAQVKHGALINGITSPAPGTAHYTPSTGPFIQTGPLKELDSTHNLAGYSSSQLIQGARQGHQKKRRKSKVYTLMPSKIAKRTASGKIDKPVSKKIYKHFQNKGKSAESKFMRNARRREAYAEKHPESKFTGCGKPKKTLEQIKKDAK